MRNFYNKLYRLFLIVAYRICNSYWHLSRQELTGVFVAVWCHRKILVIRNSYRRGLTLPSGGIKRNENPVDAAARELSEEVGIVCETRRFRFIKLGTVDYPNVRHYGHWYGVDFAEYPDVVIDQREVIWAQFMDPRDVLDLELDPQVREYLMNNEFDRDDGHGSD